MKPKPNFSHRNSSKFSNLKINFYDFLKYHPYKMKPKPKTLLKFL